MRNRIRAHDFRIVHVLVKLNKKILSLKGLLTLIVMIIVKIIKYLGLFHEMHSTLMVKYWI